MAHSNTRLRKLNWNSLCRAFYSRTSRREQSFEGYNRTTGFSSAGTQTSYNQQQSGYSKRSGLPSPQNIKSFLQLKNLKAYSGPTCFRCENILLDSKSVRMSKNKDPVLSLYINKTTGDYFCSKTGRTGSWSEFQSIMRNPGVNVNTDFAADKQDPDLKKVEQIWEHSQPLNGISGLVKEEILPKFGLDALPISCLEMYDVRLSQDLRSVIVPWFPNTNLIDCGKQAIKGSPIGLKIFSFEEDKDSKQWETAHLPANSYLGMLGMSHVSSASRRIVVTMNEFDAIAVNSASSKYKAASLPCGIIHLPLGVLPYLEQFSEVILWFNNSQVSWEAARQFARKLDEKRCRIVRPVAGAPSALEALSKNLDIDGIISSAVSAELKNIVSFTDLRGFVKDELMNCDTLCGVGWPRFPKLTKMLKGHRRGELSVITGPTGSGKTTFMSEFSLDLAMQGVATLWGSFEVQNVRLLKTKLKQFSRSRMENKMSDFETIAAKFQKLPIHFMTYNGPQSIQDVLHTMRQTAYAHDIQHVVIDNLQFMMGTMSKNMDRFMMQDTLIAEFRNFATTEHIHVSVVIHPRKEDAGLPLQISSIFGTAKATQEADNVLILQRVRKMEDGNAYNHSYIEVVKNRYDGELGRMSLHFDKNTLCMSRPPISEAGDGEVDASAELFSGKEEVPMKSSGIFHEESQTLKEMPDWIANLDTNKA